MPQPSRMLPSYDEALRTVLAHAPRMPAEQVAIEQSLGRVLIEPVLADRDQPPFHRSAMDGFAISRGGTDLNSEHVTAGVVPAGVLPPPLAPGQVVRIATGAPLPEGADAVIPIEQCQVHNEAGQERVRFTIRQVEPMANVHPRASDAAAGQEVLAVSTRIGPQHVGIAAAVGAVQLRVAQRPGVIVLTTGDEVQPCGTPAEKLQPQQIRNSNGPMLLAMLERMGAQVLAHVHVPDEPGPTLAAARQATQQAQLVVTVGGVSAGQRDLLPDTWQKLEFETLVHGIAIQPGKPVFFARRDDKLVLGLPGNPVSVLATAHLLLWPLIRQMLGLHTVEYQGLPWRKAALANAVKPSSKRVVFRAGRQLDDGSVQINGWHGSGDLVHTGAADVWVRLPQTDDTLDPGQRVDVLPMLA